MGSLCCVAARPHGASSTNREWPLTPTDPFDPFWRTNTTFSLTPNDPFYRFHSYHSHGSQSSNGIGANYSSLDSMDSRSSDSDSSRSWERFGNENSLIEGAVSDFSNLEGGFENWQDGGANFENFVAGSASRPPIFSSFLEETSFLESTYDSSSSLSDSSSDSEPIIKPPHFAPRSLPTNLQSFTPKPSSSKTLTLTLDSPPKCSICNKPLSKRSPYCPRRIVRNSDMPVIGILPCSHAYHSECLDRTTSKSRETDPACPVCDKRGTFSINTEQWAICRMKNGSPRLRALSGEGSSRVWSCGKDANLVVFSNNCVEI
ncbi:hypothetical protein LUZ60_005796 [Juncus effusus]|nr:hypothetical protein LUZ60_005796 [Juncus effusus]